MKSSLLMLDQKILCFKNFMVHFFIATKEKCEDALTKVINVPLYTGAYFTKWQINFFDIM